MSIIPGIESVSYDKNTERQKYSHHYVPILVTFIIIGYNCGCLTQVNLIECSLPSSGEILVSGNRVGPSIGEEMPARDLT